MESFSRGWAFLKQAWQMALKDRDLIKPSVMALFAGTNGFADSVPIDRMKKWESDLVRYMDRSHPEVGKDIAHNKRITEETEKKLRSALDSFKSTWS